MSLFVRRIFQKGRIITMATSFLAILVISANSSTLNSFFVGCAALGVYLFVNGKALGKVFFTEDQRIIRFGFGLFLFIVLIALTGILAIIISQVEMWHVLGMVFATVATFLLSAIFSHNDPQNDLDEEKQVPLRGRYLIPVLMSYVFFLLISLFLLLNIRSGWVEGPIWNVVPPAFLPIYFIATFVLVGIVLLPGRISIKLALTCLHSCFSLLILVIILYPGIIWYDPWIEMSRARVVLIVTRNVFGYTSLGIPIFIQAVNSFIRGLGDHILLATFTEALNIDMYWVFAFLVPLLWGSFVPLTSYKMTRMIGGSRKISVLAAFLTITNLLFLAWGKLSAGGSLSILFSFLLVYFLMRFLLLRENRAFFLAILVWIAVATTHILPGMLTISIIFLAVALKVYERIRPESPRMAGLVLVIFFVLSTFLVPSVTIMRGILIPSIGTPTWSIQNLLATSVWKLVFGVAEESPIYEAVLYNIFLWLGLVGIVYAMKRKETYNSTLCNFMFLASAVAVFDFRILEYAIINNVFGPGRVRVFHDIFGIPFAAIVIYTATDSLFDVSFKVRSSLNWRSILGGMLVWTCLSAWLLGAVVETYEIYTVGLLPTSIEAEALKYIDEHANTSYVVLAPYRMALMGVGFFGILNPEKTFLTLGQEGIMYLGHIGVPSDPSVSHMFQAMRTAGAGVGYYVATSLYRGTELDEIIAKASQIFRLVKVLSNEDAKIYIFDYKIAPIPTGPDVMAFQWDTPPSYIVQNNLLRVTINTNTSTLGVMDFWGDIYENIELDKVLVEGNPVGNLTSIEYLDPENNRWTEWNLPTEFPPADQFQFRLRFVSDALVGVVKRGESSVGLEWETGRASTLSLQVGDFTRLYIPDLVGGKNSYDTNSKDFGLLYTKSLTNGTMFHPRYEPNATYSSMTYSQISENCNLTRTPGAVSYELYVHNVIDVDQWAYIEVWLPDRVYTGTGPPLWYSEDDGKTWVFPRYQPGTTAGIPIRTINGVDINWIYTIPRYADYPKHEKPSKWWAYPLSDVDRGGELPENYTDSGGAQNRIIFGFQMPASDTILIRLGISTWYIKPLMVSYVFRDSTDASYGLRNMESGLIRFYNLGISEYVGGLVANELPTSLTITQDETDKIESIVITLQSNSTFSLLANKDIDTTVDGDEDGIPDLLQ